MRLALTGLLALGAIISALAVLAPRADRLSPPDTRIIQAAYDAAKADSGALHIDDLRVENAECMALGPGRFQCQVGFTRASERAGRLYFDAITIAATGARWELVSGLCRSGTRI